MHIPQNHTLIQKGSYGYYTKDNLEEPWRDANIKEQFASRGECLKTQQFMREFNTVPKNIRQFLGDAFNLTLRV